MTKGPERPPRARTLAAIRQRVGRLLAETPALQQADAALAARLAGQLEAIGMCAADLLAEERRLDRAVQRRSPVLARQQAASDQWNPRAAQDAARQVRGLRDAIDFPQFVTSLISGVFQSITQSNVQQLEAISELLGTVQASTEDFTAQQIRPEQAKAWALSRFPFMSLGGDAGAPQLQVREGVDLSEQQSLLQSVLGADEGEVAAIDAGDLDGTLLPLVQRKMGRDRQGVLATLVMMGLQRIVVDDGRLHASMDMRVDTSSISEQLTQDRTDFRFNAGASGSFGVGMWGASASVSTSIGKVHSDQQFSREELSSHAGLRSSVDLTFRTEQVPLDRMADQEARKRITARTPQPTAWPDQSTLSTQRALQPANLGDIPATPAAPAAPTPPGQRKEPATPPRPMPPAPVRPPSTPPGAAPPPAAARPPGPAAPPPGGAPANPAARSPSPPPPPPQPPAPQPPAPAPPPAGSGGTGGANQTATSTPSTTEPDHGQRPAAAAT